MINNKWVQKIVALQLPNGSWGHFHTLSRPTPERPMTTEQSLRRLKVLGLTGDDEPIHRAVEYMRAVLDKRIIPPDGREQVLNWNFFETMMMATWIRQFHPDDPKATEIAKCWGGIMESALADGAFSESNYESEYRQRIPKLHAGERLIGVSQFYMVNLLWGVLDARTEAAFVDHILHFPDGIYYIYGKRIADCPEAFASRQASQYIAALECLAGYACAPTKLGFARKWLLAHREEGGWDLGPAAKDGIYFPLSDSWRTKELRMKDCTHRVERLLEKLDGK